MEVGSFAAEMVNSGNWQRPGELRKLRRQILRKHAHIATACANCHKAKKKCDGGQPCSRCMQKGPAAVASCVPKQLNPAESSTEMAEVRVERPIQTHLQLKLNATSDSTLSGLPYPILNMPWMMGISTSTLSQMLRKVPDLLKPTVHLALSAMSLKLRHLQKQFATSLPSADGESPLPDARCDPRLGNDETDVCILSNPFSVSREGVEIRNPIYALQAQTGSHPEECLARIANHDCPSPVSEVDFFLTTMNDFLCNPLESNTKWTRFRTGWMTCGGKPDYGRPGCFFKLTNVAEKIPGSSIVCNKASFQVITPEQYDIARNLHPEQCRPLSHAIGDNRSGSEVLFEDPSVDTWQGLMSTASGRERINTLNEVLKSRYAPVIKEALTLAQLHPLPQQPSPSLPQTTSSAMPVGPLHPSQLQPLFVPHNCTYNGQSLSPAPSAP
eukprot:CAMPEP_0181288212 /NCGR_PEP_ID=MMETSP1101-20121128/208_1 /TAXON_ID=46948 /ORGANISM="Rhodomonas abbreviata, Strain Caron Lab Isolate" /LENGTH=441 /DNA_ID=CAMNT_0023392311 /DNA_START=196 /DNA_END=1518 /DNA_ORIENTATION=+